MFVLEGVLLGLGLFGVYLAIYIIAMTRFLLKGAPAPAPGTAIGINFAILQHNHWVFVALLACIMLGLSIVGSWPTRVAS